MKKDTAHTYTIQYYQEGDFLELTFNVPPIDCETQEVADGIFVRRAANSSNAIVGVGIHNFSTRRKTVAALLEPLKLKLPFDITASQTADPNGVSKKRF